MSISVHYDKISHLPYDEKSKNAFNTLGLSVKSGQQQQQ